MRFQQNSRNNYNLILDIISMIDSEIRVVNEDKHRVVSIN